MLKICLVLLFVSFCRLDAEIVSRQSPSQELTIDSRVPKIKLNDLTVDHVQNLLKKWNLHSVLGEKFSDLSFDGEILSLLKQEDIQIGDFPKALAVHWRKFWNKMEQVRKENGVSRHDAESDIDRNTFSKPNAQKMRRKLKTVSNTLIQAPSKGDISGYSGVAVKRQKAMISLGESGDVRIIRSADGTLEFHADRFFFNGDIIHNGKNFTSSGESFVGDGPCKKNGLNDFNYKFPQNGKTYALKVFCKDGKVSERCPDGHEGLYVIDPYATKETAQMIPMYCSQGWHLIARNTKNGPYLTTTANVPSGVLGVPSNLFDNGYIADAVRKHTSAFKYSDTLWQHLIKYEGTKISDFLAAQGGTYSGKAHSMYVRSSSTNMKWPGSSNVCNTGKHKNGCVVRWNYMPTSSFVTCNCNGHQTSEVAAYWDSNDEVRWAFTKGYGLYYKSSSGGTFAHGDGNAWVR